MNTATRTVRLFRNNRNQAVRIPKDLELPGDEAILRKDGDRLILEPASTASLLGLLKTLKPLKEDMPDIDDALPEDVDLS
ncbi:AbrB/MazE/SpoVT family DNA-binding domain-containing protein [Nitratireductor sp. XY-223]|uniref:antitoxin n=1 Tax=Hyphomicrobiales TaxID=356 RepID=UPI0010AA2702|nr:AbrB/MazE/SpoVT family DNA-binding domain-containing protein [Nitratireductor sp. XY-223]